MQRAKTFLLSLLALVCAPAAVASGTNLRRRTGSERVPDGCERRLAATSTQAVRVDPDRTLHVRPGQHTTSRAPSRSRPVSEQRMRRIWQGGRIIGTRTTGTGLGRTAATRQRIVGSRVTSNRGQRCWRRSSSAAPLDGHRNQFALAVRTERRRSGPSSNCRWITSTGDWSFASNGGSSVALRAVCGA